MMLNRTYTIPSLGFVCVVALYFLYCIAVVPFIVPRNSTLQARMTALESSGDPKDEQNPMLAQIFPENSWERNCGFCVVDNNFVLLFNEHNTNGNSVELKPCTILFLADSNVGDEAEQYRQALVLKSSEYAELTFDSEFKPVSGKNGKFVSGSLAGTVSIKSDMKSAGQEDDLAVLTKNVTFDEKQIQANGEINFQFGKNFGNGSGLIISIAPSDPTRPKSAKTISRVEMLNVNKIVLAIATDSKNPASKEERFEISCRGKFEMYPDGETDEYWIASLSRDVDVMRVNEGFYDQLTCNLLSILLGQNPANGDKKSKNNEIGSLSNLYPVKMLAEGASDAAPARIRSPLNNDLDAKAKTMIFDCVRNHLDLNSGTAANQTVTLSMNQGKQYAKGKTLSYTFGKNGMFGQLVVNKNGELVTLADPNKPGNDSKNMRLTWSDRLDAIPDPDDPTQVKCDLRGTVLLKVDEFGSMTSEETTIWFNQISSKNKSTDILQTGNTGANVVGFKELNSFSLKPDRAKIRKDVFFQTQQGNCTVREIKVWFRDDVAEMEPELSRSFVAPPYANGILPTNYATQNHIAGNTRNPVSTASLNTNSNGPGAKHSFLGGNSFGKDTKFDLRGDLIIMLVRMTGKEMKIDQIHINGAGKPVTLKEIDPKLPDDPISVVGTELKVWNPSSDKTIAKIIGTPVSPAVFKGMESKLTALEIVFNQASNLCTIIGRGQFETTQVQLSDDMISNAFTQNKPTNQSRIVQTSTVAHSADKKKMLVVRWDKGVDFNGSQLKFLGKVEAMYPLQKMYCDELKIDLEQPISFIDMKQDINPTAKMVECRGKIRFEGMQVKNGVQNTLLNAENLEKFRMYPASGQFNGEAPGSGGGRLRVTFLDDGSISVPGISNKNDTKPTASSGTEKKQLSMRFNGQIVGNAKTLQAMATNRVACGYAPVERWESVLNIDNYDQLKELGGFRLECDNMEVAKMSDPGTGLQGMELTASGATRIEGSQFLANAESVRYNEVKKTLILEGDGNILAEIFLQNTPGGDMEPAIRLQYIEYNIETKNITTSGTRGIQLFNTL